MAPPSEEAAVLGSEHLVTFVPITDIERSKAFYVDTLEGLSVVEESPFARWCSAPAT